MRGVLRQRGGGGVRVAAVLGGGLGLLLCGCADISVRQSKGV